MVVVVAVAVTNCSNRFRGTAVVLGNEHVAAFDQLGIPSATGTVGQMGS